MRIRVVGSWALRESTTKCSMNLHSAVPYWHGVRESRMTQLAASNDWSCVRRFLGTISPRSSIVDCVTRPIGATTAWGRSKCILFDGRGSCQPRAISLSTASSPDAEKNSNCYAPIQDIFHKNSMYLKKLGSRNLSILAPKQGTIADQYGH